MEPQRYGPFPYRTARDLLSFRWPGDARLALWVIPNIEFFPLDEPVPQTAGHVPDIPGWSLIIPKPQRRCLCSTPPQTLVPVSGILATAFLPMLLQPRIDGLPG